MPAIAGKARASAALRAVWAHAGRDRRAGLHPAMRCLAERKVAAIALHHAGACRLHTAFLHSALRHENR